MSRERILYRESYRKPGGKLKRSVLPVLRHTNGMKAAECFLLAAGRVSRNGQTQEFQDLRIYFHPEPQEAP